jgi:hypothetical protein
VKRIMLVQSVDLVAMAGRLVIRERSVLDFQRGSVSK